MCNTTVDRSLVPYRLTLRFLLGSHPALLVGLIVSVLSPAPWLEPAYGEEPGISSAPSANNQLKTEGEAAELDEVWDPIESVNRGIFWFNDQVDSYLLEPVAEGYDYVLPKFIKKGVTNFFNNLRYPSRLLSDLVQLKFDQAELHTKRFLINSTIGVVGFMDIADFRFDLRDHPEDFGTALGYYGISGGPYLVLPLLGPSNVRDLVGEIVDGAVHPMSYLSYTSSVPTATQNAIVYGSRGLNLVNTRARLLEAIRTAKESAVDYYLFVQSAYKQSRDNDIYDGNPPGKDELERQLETESSPVGN